MPGICQAVYNATKAFADSFSFALRALDRALDPRSKRAEAKSIRLETLGFALHVRNEVRTQLS